MTIFIGEIESINIDSQNKRIYFEGHALLKNINIIKSSDIRKTLIISKNEVRYNIPLQNIIRKDISYKYKEDKVNYDYSGFTGFIDMDVINNMGPLDSGTWSISIYIYIKGIEVENTIAYNESISEQNLEKIYVYKNKKITEISLLLIEKKINIISKIKRKSDLLFLCKNYIFLYLDTNLNIKRYILRAIIRSIYSVIHLFPISKNRITFLSDSRDSFTGNFAFIYKELKRSNIYDIKSLLNSRIENKKSVMDKIKFMYYISTSKYIILDDYYPQIYDYKLKSATELIQVWHACGSFKRFGFSRLGKDGGPHPKSKNHRNYTKAIVSSKNIKRDYSEAFGISEDKIMSTGIPRTDVFFDEGYKNNQIKKMYDKYPKLRNKKVILFAPTFRGEGQKSAHYDFCKLEIDKLRLAFGKEYVILVKMHPFIKESLEISDENKEFIIDMSYKREINDLLFISDILITDYSSVCFEFSLLNKPMIFFSYDLNEYIESRSFYYPYESFTPGPIAKNTDEIIDIIKSERFELDKLHHFRNKFFDHFDGRSTERVVKLLSIK